MNKKSNKSMKFGKQAALARQVGMSQNQLSNLLAGYRNAGLNFGLILGLATKTDPRIWGRGGDIDARRDAVENWNWEQ